MPFGVRSLLRVPGSARWGEEEEGAVVCGVMVQPAQGLGGPEVNTNTFTSHSIIVDKKKNVCLITILALWPAERLLQALTLLTLRQDKFVPRGSYIALNIHF